MKRRWWLVLLVAILGTGGVLAAEVEVRVDTQVVRTEDFGQLLGGYIGTRANNNPASKIVLTNPAYIEVAKKMLPQAPEFPNGAVMRTQSGAMLADDYFVITDEEVVDIINFCSQAGCDPMFGAMGQGPVTRVGDYAAPVFDFSEEGIKKRVRLVKEKCREYFGDDDHCLHWDIGNEPTTVPASCEGYGNHIPMAIRAVKSVEPRAIIHAPELFIDDAKVRGTETTVGECIVERINEIDSSLRIEVVTTHWYPYVCGVGFNNLRESALGVTGNAVLRWGGFGLRQEKMTYPYEIVAGMKPWMAKYAVTADSVIGLGEINPMASCQTWGMEEGPTRDKVRTTEILNLTWGGGFWHMDEMGIAGEAGIKYSQKHVHFAPSGGQYAAVVFQNNQAGKAPSYYTYSFLANHFGRRMVKTESSNPSRLSSYSAIDKDGGLRIVLINKSGSGSKTGYAANGAPETIKAKVDLGNFGAKEGEFGEAFTLKVSDFNSGGTILDDGLQAKGGVRVGKKFEYDVPDHAAVIIRVPADGSPIVPTVTITPTVTAGPSPTAGQASPTLTPVVSGGPTVTREPVRGGLICPYQFECFKWEEEYRWLATGYQQSGWTRVKDNECLSRGINKPAYRDKKRGDANCDGRVDGNDYSVWRREAIDGQSTDGRWETDFNGDNTVDESDLGVWKSFFLGEVQIDESEDQ